PYFTQTGKAGKGKRATDAPVYRHRIRQGHCCNKSVSAKKIEPIVWEKVEALLLQPETLNEGYKQALELEKKANGRQFQQKEKMLKKVEKLKQTLQNLTMAYTDPEIKMERVEYIEQREKIQADLKTTNDELIILESQLSNIPTLHRYESLSRFADEIKERISTDKWNPTSENIRQIFELLKIRVHLSDDGTGRITGSLGNDTGLSSITY
ncbi:MAG: hypothetical protein JEZ00_06640, partial [Anaerolineaceae bacterium]|nr:hypothetical protein [Anaerolineaceae bacterium]